MSECRACIVFCMDFRLNTALHEFIEKQGLDSLGTDVVRLKGSVKNIARPEHPRDREFVFDQLDTSIGLHKVSEVYLVNHEDCGAYGPEDVPDPAMELEVHKKDLARAKSLVQEKFPSVLVRTAFMWLNGKVDFLDT